MTAPLPSAQLRTPALARVLPFPDRGVPLVTLAAAVEMVTVSPRMLWVEYLTLGGSVDLAGFLSLTRSPVESDPEHAIAVETLEAVLRDEGAPVRVR